MQLISIKDIKLLATARNVKDHKTWCKKCSYEKGWITRRSY